MTTDVITANSTAQNATADNLYTGVDDLQLKQSYLTTNYSTFTSMEVTKYQPSDHTNALVKFTGVSNIPTGATITSATIYLYCNSGSGSYYIDAFNVIQSWTNSGANWNTYDGTNAWNIAGCLGSGIDQNSTAESYTSVNGSSHGYYSWDVTSLVQGWIDGSIANEGVHFCRQDAGNDSNFIRFTTSEGTDGQRPELVVVYTSGGGGTTVSPTGISSSESFGSQSLSVGSVTIIPAGISSIEAFGVLSIVNGGVFVLPSAIASQEIFGALSLAPGGVFILPSGISTQEAFGLAVLTSSYIIAPSSIDSLELFGLTNVAPGTIVIQPSGISSSEAFGAAYLSGGTIIAGSLTLVRAHVARRYPTRVN